MKLFFFGGHGQSLHTIALDIGVGEREGLVPSNVDTGQRDGLILISQGPGFLLDYGNGFVVQILL